MLTANTLPRTVGFLTGLVMLISFTHCAAKNDGRPAPAPTPQATSPATTVQNVSPPASDPPSILLLTVDALRSDHLSFYGYHKETAPFLASLAAESTVFRRAYSTSSWTVPALASMLTGVYPPVHGANHGVVQKDAVFQQEVLPSALSSIA